MSDKVFKQYGSLVIQPDHCEICLSKNKLVDDHDHKSGRYRGKLCNNCNLALGHFKDNVFTLYSAARYLMNFEDKNLFLNS